MKLYQRLVLLLILAATICKGEEELIEYKSGKHLRVRRATPSAKLEFINRSGKDVYLYYMDTTYHRRTYFARLRLNEKSHVDSYPGTTWLAYDSDSNNALLINDNFNFLVHPHFINRPDRIKMVVTLPKNLKSKEKDTPSRKQKRYRPRYIEVLVVADYSFVKHYKGRTDDVRKYIRTLMKTANQVYQDKTLDMNIHIVVKEIKLLEKNTRELIIPEKQPRRAVQNACDYIFQRKLAHKLKFDFGVVLTRKSFGYSGFTPLYRMCVDFKSCTLIKDHGMHTAFIVAHEIAHSIGVSHDGDYNGCKSDASIGSVMSPTVYSRFDKYHWSKCSRKQIEQNINYFSCLKNKPKEYSEVQELPGVSFNIDEHCSHYMGKGFTSCFGLRAPDQHCQYIFCRVPKTDGRNLCKYWNLPPLDGTKCAENRWCVRGKCLPHGRTKPEPIDGGWSSWVRWSRCSSSCGQGIRTRDRTCNNPRPEYGGKTCAGSSKDWDVCKRRKCERTLHFKDQMNDVCYKKHGENWRWYRFEEGKDEINSLKVNCTFENGLCGWKNGNLKKAKWRLKILVNSLKVNCTFENSLCRWINGKSRKQKWTLKTGETPTAKTGPSFDHTYKNKSGHYLFLEASYPLRAGDFVTLTSERITLPKTCLRFYYHMFGDRLGTLNVKIKQRNGNTETVWSRSKNQNDHWREAHTSINQNIAYQIVFEAVRGSSYYSDIAIDDVTLTLGLCKKDKKTSDKECKISCYNRVTKKFFIDETIPDAERCNETRPNDVCVFGKCRRIGCDLKINSTKVMNKCNQCGKTNKECFQSNGILSVKPKKITTTIFKTPKGASNAVFRKVTPTNGKLAVFDSRGRNGFYYEEKPPNYNWNYFNVAGVTGRYEIHDNLTDTIFLDGTSNEEMLFKILYADSKYKEEDDIRFEYELFSKKPSQRDVYVPVVQNYTQCSAVCNGGNQTAVYQCVNLRLNRTSSMEQCVKSDINLIPYTRECNKRKCEVKFTYKVGSWGSCTPCGKLGSRTRSVECLKETEGGTSEVVDEKECSKRITKRSSFTRCFQYCRKKTKKVCKERSRLCPGMFRKGYCKYKTVQSLCCKTCKSFIKGKKA